MNIVINSKDMYVQIYFKGISKTKFSDEFSFNLIHFNFGSMFLH